MIRRLPLLLLLAAGLGWPGAAAPVFAKDKPAADDASSEKKKPAKPDAKKTDSPKPDAAKKPDGKKTAEAKKPDAKDAAGKDAKNGGKNAEKTGADKSAKGKDAKDKSGKDQAGKDKAGKEDKDKAIDKEKPVAAKAPVAVGSFGDWNVMSAHGAGKDKTCYAIAEPKDRQPAKLQRDKAYVFISTRPGEGVRNEVAVILGFPLKDGGAGSAEIDGDAYELVTKGTNAWVKNPAKEKEFVEALKNGSKLVVKAPSIKGNVTTDTYSLKGLADALARVQKECQ
jgi:invasion protein IalB